MPTFELTRIPRGAAGTKKTLAAMERMASAGATNPSVVLFAQELVRNGPEYGKMADLEAILAGVRRCMRYTPDPVGVETVKAPWFTVAEIQAKGRAVMDCDDASVLAAALIRSVGIPTRFRVIKDDPQEFTHVYLEALMDNGWVRVDPIARELPLGRGPEGQFGSAYYMEGRMIRGTGMGQAKTVTGSITDAFTEAVDAVTKYQIDRFKAKATPQPAVMPRPVVVQPAAPAFPWGKVLAVAGVGVGLIVAMRMMKKRR